MNMLCRIFCLLLLPLVCLSQGRGRRVPVQLNIGMVADPPQKDQIVYAFDRPLQLSDFKGRADQSTYGAAATFSGIQMAFSGEEKAGVLYVDVQLLVYFDKSKSWTKKEGRTPEVLAHEQIHFDITAIHACAFLNAVKQYAFTTDGVRQELKALNKKYMEEMQAVQDAYDRETNHGTLPRQQAEWAAKIQKQLNQLNCYQLQSSGR